MKNISEGAFERFYAVASDIIDKKLEWIYEYFQYGITEQTEWLLREHAYDDFLRTFVVARGSRGSGGQNVLDNFVLGARLVNRYREDHPLIYKHPMTGMAEGIDMDVGPWLLEDPEGYVLELVKQLPVWTALISEDNKAEK